MSAIVVASVVDSDVILVVDFVVVFVVGTSVVETTVVVILVDGNSVVVSVVVETTVDGSAVKHGCWSSSLHLHSLGS